MLLGEGESLSRRAASPATSSGGSSSSNGNSSETTTPVPVLKPCKYQVAGHLPENGKRGSLVDERGRFYKPLQPGSRGTNEHNFYNKVFSEEFLESKAGEGEEEDEDQWASKVELRRLVPRFFGCLTLADRKHLVLEDVAMGYSKPCIMDIKIGYRTWYSAADARYNERAKKKDSDTTQATIGFKICGWQVYDTVKRKFHRVSKSKCKTMSQLQVQEAFLRFADNKSGIAPRDVYGGCDGVIGHLRDIRSWFQSQAIFKFYSSSLLAMYEGDADCAEDLRVKVRLVDFAHTYPTEGVKDRNFRDGVASLMQWLEEVLKNSEDSTSASSSSLPLPSPQS